MNALYHPKAAAGLLELGSAAGFKFDMQAPLSDTMDSHRLVLWAQSVEVGKGEALAAAVGRRYFEGGRPLADRDVLLESVAEVGLDTAAAAAHLDSREGYDDVRESVAAAHGAGIHSIPVFVFRSAGFERVVHGSSDVATFVDVLRAVEAHHADSGACDLPA